MHTFKRLSAVALLGLTFLFTACKGGPEGTYKLDKGAMKETMEAEIKKMPEEQQGFAKLMLAMIDAMDMKLTLKSGGELEMEATTPAMGKDKEAKTETKKGTWKAEGEKITLSADDKDLECKLEEKKLKCESGKEKDPPMVFIKEG